MSGGLGKLLNFRKMSACLGRVSDGPRKVSDGVRKVPVGPGKVSDSLGKDAFGISKVSRKHLKLFMLGGT